MKKQKQLKNLKILEDRMDYSEFLRESLKLGENYLMMIQNENTERKKFLYHLLDFWTEIREKAERKGWTKIHAMSDKQVRIARRILRKFKPKPINIPVQLIVNVESIRSKIDNYNPYPAIK